ncbi:hypothetical protein BKA61DRAFT_573421 [Leptodontidium sp. MPI-SDFR-AT-0119]|nr:hypothetical protein BKA61DRAFT_573421 [Leptodontidium sp. MPI-SDFR-AT-0119]
MSTNQDPNSEPSLSSVPGYIPTAVGVVVPLPQVNEEADLVRQMTSSLSIPLSPPHISRFGNTTGSFGGDRILQLVKEVRELGVTTLPISCHIIEKLILTIKTLERENYSLAASNIKGLIKSLAIENPPLATPGAPLESFASFPKLPLEIRRMVWKKALYRPQTIAAGIVIPTAGLRGNFCRPRTNLSAVCHESRVEALTVQQQLNKGWVGTELVYMNPEVDIVWVSAIAISDCEWVTVFNRLSRALLPKCIPKFALALDVWTRLMCGGRIRPRFLDIVAKFDTEEMVVVVGSCAAFGSPDLELIEPRQSPINLLHTNFIARFGIPARPTWEEIEKAMMWEIRNCQNINRAARMRMIETGQDPDDAMHRGTYKDLSHWKFNNVRFMEAIVFGTKAVN